MKPIEMVVVGLALAACAQPASPATRTAAAATQTAAGLGLTLSPTTLDPAARPGSPFDVAVRVTAAAQRPVGVWQFDLHFNPGVLQLQSTEEGSFLRQCPGARSTAFFAGRTDNTQGQVTGLGGAVIGGPGQLNCSGAGVLATLHFRVIVAANPELELANIVLGDPASHAYAPDQYAFNVPPAPTPTPPPPTPTPNLDGTEAGLRQRLCYPNPNWIPDYEFKQSNAAFEVTLGILQFAYCDDASAAFFKADVTIKNLSAGPVWVNPSDFSVVDFHQRTFLWSIHNTDRSPYNKDPLGATYLAPGAEAGGTIRFDVGAQTPHYFIYDDHTHDVLSLDLLAGMYGH